MSDLTISIRSGRTTYYLGRNPEGRDSYIVKGRASTDAVFVWRVKKDPTSNRHFFVNDGGLGKKWRLPDYREASFQEELRLVLPHQPDYDPLTSLSVSHNPNDSGAVSEDGFARRVESAHGGGGDSSAVMDSIQGVPSGYHDEEWAAAEASHNRAVQLRVAEERRSQELVAEREMLRRAKQDPHLLEGRRAREQTREGTNTPTPLVTPTSSSINPIYQQQETGDQYGRVNSVPVTRQRSPPQHRLVSPRGEDEMARVERDHASQLLREAERLLLASERGLSTTTTNQSYATPRLSSSSVGGGGEDSRYVAHQVASLTQVIDGLQRMLEHERQTNARLTRELQERDRIIMERNLADAEAEEDDTRFKMRMLEALSSKKRESDRDRTLADEQRARSEYALQQDLIHRR
jgi:hypothetical protein